eukprot:2396843-Pleurochrysis_carterae.AAC.4
MVEGQDCEQLTVRSDLHPAFPYLRQYVVVGPAELRRRRPQRGPIELAGAREGGVARRALHRVTVVRVAAVPDHPTRPGRHFQLGDGHGRHVRDCHVLPRCAGSQGADSGVGRHKPRRHSSRVHSWEEKV